MPTGIYIRTKWHIERLKNRRPGYKHTQKTKVKMRIARLKNPIKSIGSKNYFWNGGRYKSYGYIKIWMPKHPFCDSKGYVSEHRLIMEKHIGRFLNKKEVIHHINHIRDDNKIENLKLMKKVEHDRFHTIKRHKIEPLFGR